MCEIPSVYSYDKPHEQAIWDENRKAWKLGHLWYMPHRGTLCSWCWFDWDKDEVIAECMNPDAKIIVTIVD